MLQEYPWAKIFFYILLEICCGFSQSFKVIMSLAVILSGVKSFC